MSLQSVKKPRRRGRSTAEMTRFVIPFQIGVAKSRFVKPCVKISKVGSHPLVDDCPLNRRLYHHRRQSI